MTSVWIREFAVVMGSAAAVVCLVELSMWIREAVAVLADTQPTAVNTITCPTLRVLGRDGNVKAASSIYDWYEWY